MFGTDAAVVLFLLYMLPSAIAQLRKHQSWPAITALNVLLGWTALGWIIAFIWSLTAVRRETIVYLRDR